MSANTDDTKTNDTRSGSTAADDVRHAFSGLPFEQKISTLIRIELDMLGDAVDTVVSAASKAVDDIATACSEPSGTKTASSGGQASTT
jgi:hypothetical protein